MKILSLRFVVKVKISVFRLESWVFSRTIRRYVLIEFAQISVLLGWWRVLLLELGKAQNFLTVLLNS